MGEAAGKIEYSLSDELLEDPSVLRQRILQVVQERLLAEPTYALGSFDRATASGVMFLLGRLAPNRGAAAQICIVLNKRSQSVRQSGDLCCPGGTVETRLDRHLAKLLLLPFSPLKRWPLWKKLHHDRPQSIPLLALLVATALREGWEEMRLNPFGIDFLGPLPLQRLILFQRVIYPMAGWIRNQHRFVPSWEVEKIVAIPLRSLLNPIHYANYRIYVPPAVEKKLNRTVQDMPCFLHRCQDHTEILWGATYRIVMQFLELVFGFSPPDPETLPMVPGIMDENYICSR